MNKILFTVRFGNMMDDFDASLDTFFPLEISEEKWELVMHIEAIRELSVVPEDVETLCNEISSYIRGTQLILRFHPDMYQHICVVILPEGVELDRDGLEAVINSKSKEELKRFLNDAKL